MQKFFDISMIRSLITPAKAKPLSHTPTQPTLQKKNHHRLQARGKKFDNVFSLSKGRGSVGAEDLLGVLLGDAVGEGELEVLGEELADVGTLDVLGLLELDNAEDLEKAIDVSKLCCVDSGG